MAKEDNKILDLITQWAEEIKKEGAPVFLNCLIAFHE